MEHFKNTVLEQAFFRLVLRGTISLEQARKIIESYKGDLMDLLFVANELIDSAEQAQRVKDKEAEKEMLLAGLSQTVKARTPKELSQHEIAFGSVKTKEFRRDHTDRAIPTK